MQNFLLLILFIFFSTSYFAQELPKTYELYNSNYLLKTADKTPASNTIERIIFSDKSTIWLGTSKGASKSTDNGASWTNYYKTQSFGEESVSALGFYSGTIWVATWKPKEFLGQIIGVGSGLRYSIDNGSTWTSIPQPVDAKGDSVIFYGVNKLKATPITVAEENFIYDIAFTKNTVWIVSRAAGLRKSTDLGKTWQRVVLPPDNLNSIKPTDLLNFSLKPKEGTQGNLNHIAFSILAVDDDTLYVGTAGGINKSTDGGISWIKFNNRNQLKPISGDFVLSIESNEFDNSIWAATWKAEGQSEYWGVSYSHDGGKSWNIALSGERILDFAFKYYGQKGSYTGADVFAAAWSGAYRSNNNGLTWLAAPKLIDSDSRITIKATKYLSIETNQLEKNSTDVWIGTNDGLAKGNETNGLWADNWKIFLASTAVASSAETYAFPNPFSPDVDIARIKYSLQKSSNVTIRIFDFGMNLVKTVLQNAYRGENSDQIDSWDGKDENENIVPNGVYFYRIDLDSGGKFFGKIIVLL